MRLKGNPGPARITVFFEEGEFKGKSVTMDADQLVGGVALYAFTMKQWDDQEAISVETRKKIYEVIKEMFEKHPEWNSEIIENP